MAQAGSLARALCIPGVAMQSHPTCIQRHIYVGLDLLNIRRLSMVGRCWSDTGRAIIAEVKDATTAVMYRPLQFSVDALGNLFENASDADEKLRTSMRCALRTSTLEDPELEKALLYWYRVQLHLHVFCQRNASSILDIARRVFQYEHICEPDVLGLVLCMVLNKAKALEPAYGQLLDGDPEVLQPIDRCDWWCKQLIDPKMFHHNKFVETRDMGCPKIGASPQWHEVLMTLLCLLRGRSYCPYYCLREPSDCVVS